MKHYPKLNVHNVLRSSFSMSNLTILFVNQDHVASVCMKAVNNGQKRVCKEVVTT
jgi:hypothetical protein